MSVCAVYVGVRVRAHRTNLINGFEPVTSETTIILIATPSLVTGFSLGSPFSQFAALLA